MINQKDKKPIDALDKSFYPYDNPNVELNFHIPNSLKRFIDELESSIKNDRWDVIDMNKGSFDVSCKHLCSIGVIDESQLEMLRRRYLI